MVKAPEKIRITHKGRVAAEIMLRGFKLHEFLRWEKTDVGKGVIAEAPELSRDELSKRIDEAKNER